MVFLYNIWILLTFPFNKGDGTVWESSVIIIQLRAGSDPRYLNHHSLNASKGNIGYQHSTCIICKALSKRKREEHRNNETSKVY